MLDFITPSILLVAQMISNNGQSIVEMIGQCSDLVGKQPMANHYIILCAIRLIQIPHSCSYIDYNSYVLDNVLLSVNHAAPLHCEISTHIKSLGCDDLLNFLFLATICNQQSKLDDWIHQHCHHKQKVHFIYV